MHYFKAMTSDVETIVADFRKMKNKDRETVKSLVEKHFSEVILEEYEPLADYAESLPEEFLVRIKSVDFKNFAQDIHRLWPSLIKLFDF